MSEDNQERGSSVMFVRSNGPGQFPTPLPRPPRPNYLAEHASEGYLMRCHIIQGVNDLAVKAAAAPIERVHLLMQNQNELIRSGRLSTPYKGIIDCFLRTIKSDGIISLWRGNSMNVLKVFTSQALAFAIERNKWHNRAADNENDEYGDLKFQAAVCTATLLQHPLDYAHTLLATDVKAATRTWFSLDSARKNLMQEIPTRQFRNMFDVYSKTLRRDGISGLYRGYSLSFLGFLAIGFSFNKVKPYCDIDEEADTVLARIRPYAVAYSVPVAFYPLITVCRRMMVNSGEATARYKGPVHAFSKIVKLEGFSSLYNGITAGMILCLARFNGSRFRAWNLINRLISRS